MRPVRAVRAGASFDGASLKLLIVKILRGVYPPVPARYGKTLRDTVREMLSRDPARRPSVNDLLARRPFRDAAKRLLDDACRRRIRTPCCTAKKRREPDGFARTHRASRTSRPARGRRGEEIRGDERRRRLARGAFAPRGGEIVGD